MPTFPSRSWMSTITLRFLRNIGTRSGIGISNLDLAGLQPCRRRCAVGHDDPFDAIGSDPLAAGKPRSLFLTWYVIGEFLECRHRARPQAAPPRGWQRDLDRDVPTGPSVRLERW